MSEKSERHALDQHSPSKLCHSPSPSIYGPWWSEEDKAWDNDKHCDMCRSSDNSQPWPLVPIINCKQLPAESCISCQVKYDMKCLSYFILSRRPISFYSLCILHYFLFHLFPSSFHSFYCAFSFHSFPTLFHFISFLELYHNYFSVC